MAPFLVSHYWVSVFCQILFLESLALELESLFLLLFLFLLFLFQQPSAKPSAWIWEPSQLSEASEEASGASDAYEADEADEAETRRDAGFRGMWSGLMPKWVAPAPAAARGMGPRGEARARRPEGGRRGAAALGNLER